MEPFRLEEYFARHEFSAKYQLCNSDAQSMSMKDLLALSDSECLDLWENLWLGYTEAPGSPILRREIAKLYPGLSSDNILCFAGAEEGIYCSVFTLLQKSDHCIAVTPCYQSLKTIAESVASVTYCDLNPDHGWDLDLDLVRAAIRPNTKLIVMNFPHNPTGASLSHEKLEGLIALAREHDIWVFSDEVYRGLEIDPAARLPTVASIYEKGISLGVVSKSLGLAGLRIGWIACQQKVELGLIAGTKHYLSICNSAPSEVLALIALRNADRLLERNLSIIHGNLALIDEFLARRSDLFDWVSPSGGCCGFMRFKGQEQTKMTLNEFADIAVNQFGVLILPGDNFPGNEIFADRFRFGFGRSNFASNLLEFEKAIDGILASAAK